MSGALVALSTGILGCIRRLPSTVWFYFDAQNGTNPFFPGKPEGNSLKNTILPWLRRIEQLNTHETSYGLSMAGGVATAQILPGGTNNIGTHHLFICKHYKACAGGQAIVIQLRPTAEISNVQGHRTPPPP